MTVTAEQIAAFVDDELDDAARARVAEAALRDPAIAGRIAAERSLRNQLRAHFVMDDPQSVPPEWIALIDQATTAPVVFSMAEARARRAPAAGSARRWVGAAIAATLVIAVGLGLQPHQRGSVVTDQARALASGDLARALDVQLASAQDGAPIRILGTFRRPQGDLCRVFAGLAASGIACHADTGWAVVHTGPGAKPADSAYRQAGSAQADLMAQAQTMAAGDLLNADDERTARQRGWH